MIFQFLVTAFLFLFVGTAVYSDSEKMILIPGGKYVPFYPDNKSARPNSVQVKAFLIDVYPVTNSDYFQFARQSPEWRRSKIKRIYADTHYLQNWKSDLEFSDRKMSQAPVTFVSWFSAKAYCESLGKELPTMDQWEYAAYDEGRSTKETKDRVLKWFSRPNDKELPTVGSTPKNGFGVYDLQGLVWEWVYDFNSPIGGDSVQFCGGSAVGTTDSSDYVNYMRFAFRSSLKASYTTANLGFRCVKEVKE